MPLCYTVKKTVCNRMGAESPLWETRAPSPLPYMYTYVYNTPSARPETDNVRLDTDGLETVIDERTETYDARHGNYDVPLERYETDSSSQSPRYVCDSFTKCKTSDTQHDSSRCAINARSDVNAQYMYVQCSNVDSQSEMYNPQAANCNTLSNAYIIQPEKLYIRSDNYETRPETYYLQPENFDTLNNYNTQCGNYNTQPVEYIHSNNNNIQFENENLHSDKKNTQPDAATDNYGTQTDNSGTHSYGTQTDSYGAQTDSYGTQTVSYSAQTNCYGTRTDSYGTQTDSYGAQTNCYGAQTDSYGTQTDSYNSDTDSFISQSQTYLQCGKFTGSPTFNFRQGSSETNARPEHTAADTEGAHDLLALSRSLPPLSSKTVLTPQPLGDAQPVLIAPTSVFDGALTLKNEVQNTDIREQFVTPTVITQEREFVNQQNTVTHVAQYTDCINRPNMATFMNPNGDIITQRNVTQNAIFFNQEDVATLMTQEPDYTQRVAALAAQEAENMDRSTRTLVGRESAVTPRNIILTRTIVPTQLVVLTNDRPAEIYDSVNLVRPRENPVRLTDVNSVRAVEPNFVRPIEGNWYIGF